MSVGVVCQELRLTHVLWLMSSVSPLPKIPLGGRPTLKFHMQGQAPTDSMAGGTLDPRMT